jgi:hypothetical protein
MGRRGAERGVFGFTGPEMTAVKLVMDIHDAQLDECTVQNMEKALFIVEEEIRLKKARPIVEQKPFNGLKFDQVFFEEAG